MTFSHYSVGQRVVLSGLDLRPEPTLIRVQAPSAALGVDVPEQSARRFLRGDDGSGDDCFGVAVPVTFPPTNMGRPCLAPALPGSDGSATLQLMYELRNPTPELSPWIENYWLVSGPTELSVNVFVDGRADLIFNFGAPYRREIIGSGQRFISESNLDAQRLYPIQIHQQGEVHTVGVRFRLGGLAPFLIPSADSITDKTLPVSLAFGRAAACLERKLRAESDFNAVKCILDEFFLAQRQSDPRLARFQRIMLDAPDFAVRVAVEELSRRYASPARSLERLFARYLGLSPKTLLRILRFQASLRALMRDPGCTLAQLSAELGYYDQAHFVKEFRRMSGGVPRGYRGYFPPQGPDDFAPNVVAFVQDGTDGDG